MLSILAELLRTHALLAPGEIPEFNIRLITGEQLNVQVFSRDGSFFHTRVKRRGVVPEEYDRCYCGWRSFPNYAPEPLLRHLTDGWEIIVVRGIPHETFAIGDIAKNRRDVVKHLSEFFAASSALRMPAMAESTHGQFLRQLATRIADLRSASIVRQWIERTEVDLLPSIPQHGDLVVSNLGSGRSRLVIFDWEDFGRVSLPGFDLGTLLASDVGLEAGGVRAIMQGLTRPGHPYQQLVAQVCPLIGLPIDTFRRLIPLYLAIFLDLKNNYGTAVRVAVRNLIEAVDRASPAAI